MFYTHINAQILIKFSDRSVRGELYVTLTPLTKANALDFTAVWRVEPSRKMAWQDFAAVRSSSSWYSSCHPSSRHVRTIFPSVRSFVRTKISRLVSCSIPGTCARYTLQSVLPLVRRPQLQVILTKNFIEMLIKKMVEYPNDPRASCTVCQPLSRNDFFAFTSSCKLMLSLAVCSPSRVEVFSAAKLWFNV